MNIFKILLTTILVSSIYPVLAADLNILSRYSEVTLAGTNLGFEEPIVISSDDVANNFDEAVVGDTVEVQINGCINTGMWDVNQNTVVTPGRIDSDHMQIADVSTDCGSPLITTQSVTEIQFMVSEDTDIILDGVAVGSAEVSEDEFSRTLLRRGVNEQAIFNSFFGFPFEVTLDANVVYKLVVDIRGRSFDNNDFTTSSADVELIVLVDSDSDGVFDHTDNCIDVANALQTDSDSDGYGNSCDGDFNNDCIINFVDFSLFAGEFLGANPVYDLNSDGAVNFLDFASLSTSFLMPPGPGLDTGLCEMP